MSTAFMYNKSGTLYLHDTGCEVAPDVNSSAQKYNIKLFVPGNDGLTEVWIRADTVSTISNCLCIAH